MKHMRLKIPLPSWLRCFVYDVRASRRDRVAGVIFPGMLIALSCVLAYSDAAQRGIEPADLTLGDCLLIVFAGKGKPEWRPGIVLTPPVEWVLLFMVACYFWSCYPYRDLHTFGYRSYIGAGGRSKWWCSKFGWLLFSVSLFWAAALSICALIGAINSSSLSYSVTPEGAALAGGTLIAIEPSVLPALTVAIMSSFSIAAVQHVLSLLLRPVVGFGVSAVLLVLSYFIYDPVMPANGMMLLRSDVLFERGLSGCMVALCATLALFLSFFVGAWVFRRIDFYQIKG